MHNAQKRQKGFFRFSICLCFFLSGAAGLVYEIVWMRMLGLIFGHTVFALTTVLAAFMAGLGLGAYVFGHLIDRRGRPLRIYGFLEAGVGFYAGLIPVFFAAAETIYVWLYRALSISFSTFVVAQFFLAFLILLVPTTLMGASLPVLAKYFVDRAEGLGQKVGDLYAINTFGAVLGAAGAGFFLLPLLGVKATIFLAAAINFVIGAWALLADRWKVDDSTGAARVLPAVKEQEINIAPLEAPSFVLWLVVAGIALSGAASMVYEIAWTRALTLIIGSSIYAFSAMLTTFLIGIALGSFVFARIWGRRSVNSALFGWLEVLIGFSALALIPAFRWMPDVVLLILKRTTPTPTGALIAQFGVSFLTMIVTTTILGATFPCAAQIYARILSGLGRKIGQVYSANTIGCIVGAVIAGFLLVPWVGARSSMMAAAAVNMVTGAAILAVSIRTKPLRYRIVLAVLLLFVVALALVPRWDPRVMVGGASIYTKNFVFARDPAAAFRAYAAARQLVFYREGITSTVSVERTDRNTSLRVNGKVDASDGMDMITQLMMGHLPMFLHPNPERALVIGLGSGVTAGAMIQHPVLKALDVVELEPAVMQAAAFFGHVNRNFLRDPRVHVVFADGRNFILASNKKYDVISSEPSNPWMAGVANLFSLDFYELVRQRLAANGLMVQWMHSYSLFPREFRMILNTFRQVFPHVTVWRTIGGDYLLVGSLSKVEIDYALLKKRFAASRAVRDDMVKLRLESPIDLLTLFYADETALDKFTRGALVNTDDKPLLEFSAPLALYANTTDLNSELLVQAGATDFPAVRNLSDEEMEARRFHFAEIYWAKGEPELALRQLRKAPPPAASDFSSQLKRAKLLFSLGQIAQATDDLGRIRPQNDLIKSYLKAGEVLHRIKADEEIAAHGRTRFGDANPAEALNNLGIFYTRLGIRFTEPAFFDLAADALQAALTIEPQSYALLINLANAFFELGKLDMAASAYRQVIRLMPDLAEARFNLGLVYEKQGSADLAAREYEKVIILNPSWRVPRVRLAALRADSALREKTEGPSFPAGR
ncbi:MAG: fused MFS/spermidine synthase [Alphaproteobacteria bacterium]